jgi:hypothetical protein
MLDQLFDTFRKASESSLHMQQDMFKYWTQQLSGASGAAGNNGEWSKNYQKQVVDLLNKQREALDSAFKTGIQLIEQTFRASEAKSPDDYRRTMEDLWRTLIDTFKSQTETQVREFQKWSEKSFDMAAQNGQS